MKQKPKDLFVILFIYLIALGAAILTLRYAPISSMLWKTAVANGVATVIVFLFSVKYNNSCVFDPYWSAAPVFISLYWLLKSGHEGFLYKIIWILIVFWGVRLTWNWILRWDGFKDEDWRYVNIRKKTGKWYWVVSFFGVHVFPSALMFIGLVPVYFTMISPPEHPGSWWVLLAYLFTNAAILLEKTADDQLRRHLKATEGRNVRIQTGVWLVLKYPNYLGEMMFWWGLFFFAVAVDRDLWWTVFGPAAITFLFLFISIPMMRKRVNRKTFE